MVMVIKPPSLINEKVETVDRFFISCRHPRQEMFIRFRYKSLGV